MPKTIKAHKAIILTLKENHVGFHIFQLRTEKSFRFVINNIHHTTNINDLKEEIEGLHFGTFITQPVE